MTYPPLVTNRTAINLKDVTSPSSSSSTNASNESAAASLNKLKSERNPEDFKFSISPSEKEKLAKKTAIAQTYGEFDLETGELVKAGEEQIRRGVLEDAKSDFLIINDVPISGAAVSSISIQTDADVFIAETLRTSSPIIEPKGTGLDVVTISLSFPNGKAQSVFLKRIVAEIIRHPFIFIENTKIRDAIGYGTKTMIFALHSASLRSGGEAVGLIFLDLQLSIFNYKPFSNHYWYNSVLPGLYKDERNTSRVAEVLMPDYGGRFSFDYDINKYEEFAFEDLSPSDYSINTPTVYPADSQAWMYYANHLEEKIGPVSETNSDYVGLVLTRYKIFQPPPGARISASNPNNVFGVHGKYKKVGKFFDASAALPTMSLSPLAGIESSSSGGITYEAEATTRGLVSRPKGRTSDIYFSKSQEVRDFKEVLSGSLSLLEDLGTKSSIKKELQRQNRTVKLKEEVRSILIDVADLFPGRRIVILKTIGSGDGPHGRGQAIDLKVQGVSTEKLYYAMRELKGWGRKKGGAGYYPNAKFCHFDVRKTKKWWIDISKAGEKTKKSDYLKGTEKENRYERLKKFVEGGEYFDDYVKYQDSQNTTETKKIQEGVKKQQSQTETNNVCIQSIDQTEQGATESKTSSVNIEERNAWIAEIENKGWTYHKEAGTRNVFYRDEHFFVGGGPSKEKDIILSAITVNFGHRLAQMKPLGQHAPAWQFMGAGNKSGIFVFSAANEAGRESLKRFRKFYQISQENVRLFPYIEGSGSIRIEYLDLTNIDKVNNILSLAGVNEIVITNIENQTDSSQGVDIHSLVVSWVAYEIPKEELKARDQVDINVKFKMIKQLFSHMKYWTTEKGDAGYEDVSPSLADYAVRELSRSNYSVPSAQFGTGNLAGFPQADVVEKVNKRIEKEYTKYLDRKSLFESRRANHHVGPKEDILEWDSSKGQYTSPKNSKFNRIEWYVNLVRRLDNVLKKYKTRFPNMNCLYPGGKDGETWATKVKREIGVNGYKILQGKKSKDGEYGFVLTSGVEERQRIISTEYNAMMDEISNNVIDHAFARVADADNFKELFGADTWKSIMDSYLTEPGECYIDLDMPPELTSRGFAKGNGIQGVNYPPDFYIYDDSSENAVLDEANNPKNIENMVRSHLVNEARSINEYARKILFSGSSISSNAIKVRENKANLNEMFGSEYDYFGIGGVLKGQSAVGNIEGFGNRILAWGINAFSAVLDDVGGENNYEEYGETIQAKINKTAFEEASGGPDGYSSKQLTPGQKKIDGFLNMSLDWASLSTNFTLHANQGSNTEGRLAVREAAKAHVYGSYTYIGEEKSALEEITFGPDQAKLESDGLIYGVMSPRAEDTVLLDPDTGEVKKKKTTPYRDAPAYDPYNFDIPDFTSDIETAGQENKPTPSKTEEEYLPPAAKNDFTDTFSTYAAGIAAKSRQKDLSMRRAYPTFKIYFIEEDSHQASSKLRAFDDFYSYSSVQEIRVIRSRKVAADLAIIRLTNVGDILLSKRFQRGDDDRMRENNEGREIKQNADGTVTGTNKKQQPEREKAVGLYSQTREENPYHSMMIQPGVKTQIRLGYASDPDNLETVFLGQIIEVQPSEDNNIIEVVCQGYGAELEASECGDIDKASPAYSSQSALSAAICLPFITHFGRKEKNAMYNPAEIRTHLDGGTADDLIGNPLLLPFNILGSVVSSFYHERMRKYNFLNYPQDDNIYAPPVSLYVGAWQRFWDNAAAYRPINSTTWDVFKEHELRHPGFIASPVPYGHSGRMTMFFGSKGQNYWSKPPSNRSLGLSTVLSSLAKSISWDINKFYSNGVGAFTPDMRQKLERLQKENPSLYKAFMQSLMGMGGEKAIGYAVGRAFGRYVPFRNYHMFTSEHHILKNTIRANVQGTYNAVEIRYSNDEDIATMDTWLMPEWLEALLQNKGEKTVELYNKVQEGTDGRYTLKLNDKMPDHLVRKHMEAYPSCITDYMAARYAQGLMIRGLKDVYRGELVVVGDERIKPYDICMLQDNKNDMYGPVEVEQIVHIFNSQKGFCSIVTPDLCIDFNDFTGKGIMDSIISITSLAWAIGTDSTMASLAKDYDTNESISSAIAAGYFAPGDALFGTNVGKIIGSAMLMHYDQTGSPFIITPLMYGGKPMLGLSLAPNYGNWASNLWGEFKDWYHDYQEGARQFDLGESLQDFGLNAEEWTQELLGNKLDWED